MAIAWPSGLHIREARLRIVAPSYGRRSEANMSAAYGPAIGEVWAGSIVLAPLSRAQALEYEAFRGQLRGRLKSFRIPAGAGFLTSTASASGTTQAVAACGQDTVTASLTAGQTLPAGTLLNLGGTPDAEWWQTLELLADTVTTGSAQSFSVAPRIRHAFGLGTTLTTVSPIFRMRLAADDGGGSDYNVSTAQIVLNVVEAVGLSGIA